MKVLSVNIGRAAALVVGPHGDPASRIVQSGIVKRAVVDRVAVKRLGLEGDEQVDQSVHGGLAKAVYAYPSEHFAFWRTVRAQARVAAWDAEIPPGLVGENLTLEGLLESEVWVGDQLRFADCLLAVNAPRHPCFKFNAVMGFSQAAKLMAQSGYCGFYLGVVETGSLIAGEAFELIPGPREVAISELFRDTMSSRRI